MLSSDTAPQKVVDLCVFIEVAIVCRKWMSRLDASFKPAKQQDELPELVDLLSTSEQTSCTRASPHISSSAMKP